MLRIITSFSIMPVILGTLFLGTPFHFLILTLVASSIASYEYFAIVGSNTFTPSSCLGTFFSALLPLAAFYYSILPILILPTIFVICILAINVFKGPDYSPALLPYKNPLTGIVYVGALLSYFIFLRNMENGAGGILFLFAVIWTGDTGAYYIGKNFGKNKLAPLVSPGKTVEGAFGGFLGNILGAIMGYYIFYSNIPLVTAICAALIIGTIGQIGDLAESLIKRKFSVKDSGRIIPGHGGILDRLDSLLFAAPALYCFLYFVNL